MQVNSVPVYAFLVLASCACLLATAQPTTRTPTPPGQHDDSDCVGLSYGKLRQIVSSEVTKQLCADDPSRPSCGSGDCTGKGLSFGNPAASCEEVLTCNPSARSGNFYLLLSGRARPMYCKMEANPCGKRGMMRVAYMNSQDRSYNCPSPLTTYTANGKRLCGGTTNSRMTCDSVSFDTHDFQYKHVCGQATGYSYYHPCGFWTPPPSIDTAYLSGVSVTHGSPGNRRHIWSYAGGFQETSDAQGCNCPCAAAPGTIPGSYVGNDYLCESATRYRPQEFQWYTNNTLWDNQGCFPGSQCCSKSGAPWFTKVLPTATSDDMELRWCTIQGLTRDRVGTELVEMYVY